jgi:hypothetical protein
MAEERYFTGIVGDIGDVGPIPAAALQRFQREQFADGRLGRPVRVESQSENRLVYLPDGPEFERALHVLETLRALQRTVLVEIQGLLIQKAKPTLVGIIVLGFEDADGNYTIQLDCSPGRFVLFISDFSQATYDQYRGIIVAAQDTGLICVSLQPGGVRIDFVGTASSMPMRLTSWARWMW